MRSRSPSLPSCPIPGAPGAPTLQGAILTHAARWDPCAVPGRGCAGCSRPPPPRPPRCRDPAGPRHGVSAVASPPGWLCGSQGWAAQGATEPPPGAAPSHATAGAASPRSAPAPPPRVAPPLVKPHFIVCRHPDAPATSSPFSIPGVHSPPTLARAPSPVQSSLHRCTGFFLTAEPLRRLPARRLAPAHPVCFKGVTILINSIIIIIIIITTRIIIIIIEIINKDFFLQPGRLWF